MKSTKKTLLLVVLIYGTFVIHTIIHIYLTLQANQIFDLNLITIREFLDVLCFFIIFAAGIHLVGIRKDSVLLDLFLIDLPALVLALIFAMHYIIKNKLPDFFFISHVRWYFMIVGTFLLAVEAIRWRKRMQKSP